MRPCAECGAGIPPQQGSSRPRKFCVDCRPPRKRRNPRVVSLPVSPPAEAEHPGLVEAYRRRLEDAGRLETPEGATVLHLAMLLAGGEHTASGAASLAKELRSALGVALKGAPRQADTLDELAARRSRKATGA